MKKFRTGLLAGIILCACFYVAFPATVKAEWVNKNVSEWADNSTQYVDDDTILNLDVDKTIKQLILWSGSLTVTGNGTLTVAPTGNFDKPVTVKTGRTLTVSGGILKITSRYMPCISTEGTSGITINGGILDLTSSVQGIKADSGNVAFNLNGGKVTMSGVTEGFALGLTSTITVEGKNSELNVTSVNGAAISAYAVNLNGGKITAVSTNAGAACIRGINSLNISNADVTATNNGTGENALLSDEGKITISGKNTKVTPTGNICGKTGIEIPAGFSNNEVAQKADGFYYVVDEDGNILTNDFVIKRTKYSLEYAPNGGSGTMAPREVYIGDDFVFPDCDFTAPEEKAFDYWKIIGNDGHFEIGDIHLLTVDDLTGGKITVTAYWKDDKRAAVTTKPQGKNLTYNGSEQELVTEGAAKNGTMNYAIGDDDETAPDDGWSVAVPKRSGIGTYYVWYKAKGNDGYEDSEAGCTTAVISDEEPVKVEGVKLSEDELTLGTGRSGKVKAVITPDNATDQTVSWESDDENIAKISTDGKECTVTGVKAGKTKIRVKTNDGGFEAVCTVIVEDKHGKDEDDDDDDDDRHTEEASKPAVINPDTVEGYFAVGGRPVPGVAMGKTKQGPAAQAILDSSRPKGWMQAFSFNMAVNGKVDHTLKTGVLTIIIPKEYRKAGRAFAIMALDKNGKAWVYPDTDKDPATVTASINVEAYAFAVVYKD